MRQGGEGKLPPANSVPRHPVPPLLESCSPVAGILFPRCWHPVLQLLECPPCSTLPVLHPVRLPVLPSSPPVRHPVRLPVRLPARPPPGRKNSTPSMPPRDIIRSCLRMNTSASSIPASRPETSSRSTPTAGPAHTTSSAPAIFSAAMPTETSFSIPVLPAPAEPHRLPQWLPGPNRSRPTPSRISATRNFESSLSS